jgi:hypothetical protein
MEDEDILTGFILTARSLLEKKGLIDMQLDLPFGIDRPVFVEFGSGTRMYENDISLNGTDYCAIYDILHGTITNVRSGARYGDVVDYNGMSDPELMRMNLLKDIYEQVRKTVKPSVSG